MLFPKTIKLIGDSVSTSVKEKEKLWTDLDDRKCPQWDQEPDYIGADPSAVTGYSTLSAPAEVCALRGSSGESVTVTSEPQYIFCPTGVNVDMSVNINPQ